MKRNDLILMSLLVLALGGCASSSQRTDIEERRVDLLAGGARAIQVYVVVDAGSEDLSVDEEPIHRKKNNNNDIEFVLNAPNGYYFPANAVTFDDARQAPDPDEIACTTRSPTKVICTNRHRYHDQKYKYTLRVKNSLGAVISIDPFINNH